MSPSCQVASGFPAGSVSGFIFNLAFFLLKLTLNAKVCWSGDKSAGLPLLLKLASFPFLSEMTTLMVPIFSSFLFGVLIEKLNLFFLVLFVFPMISPSVV
ncbi:hypothetical protein [Synechococcus sp. PROS-U-1]|uniref:hypothetical protein n=1 Tax=Synechococcus sp. PROS-U-1 TaxID=1400866 RepID=UPI001644E73C|nr:hypothetical protein [Synechococcus sp. PROS-U-1]